MCLELHKNQQWKFRAVYTKADLHLRQIIKDSLTKSFYEMPVTFHMLFSFRELSYKKLSLNVFMYNVVSLSRWQVLMAESLSSSVRMPRNGKALWRIVRTVPGESSGRMRSKFQRVHVWHSIVNKLLWQNSTDVYCLLFYSHCTMYILTTMGDMRNEQPYISI